MEMAETFTALLAAHLIGDFVFQTEWMVERKRRPGILFLHVAILTALSCLLLGAFDWRILLAILATHFLMDAVKVHFLPDSLAPLLADQFVHLAVLLALAFYFPDAVKSGWWVAGIGPDLSKRYFALLTVVSGAILCVPAGGILIARLTDRFNDEMRDNEIAGLNHGGRYIGWLERSVAMLLLLMGQPNAIGFLLAAKSILRFGEIREPSQRKVAEYIIIGTFLSFGWALLTAELTQKALGYWIP
jgi:hypothetical protein